MQRHAVKKLTPTRHEPDASLPPEDRSTCDLHRLILDSIHDGVFTIDADFRITSFNASAERITGMPRSKAVGKKCYEVFRASVCQTDCALKRTLKTGRPLRRMRVDILDAAMHTVPIEVSTAVLRRGQSWVGGIEIFRDVSETEALREELGGKQQYRNIIGDSPAMQDIFRVLPDIAQSDAPVLIEGPSGTGKELFAQAIHELSSRRERQFVKVNCAALPDTLLESELFGFEKGAFTDARRDKAGRFVLADQGTLFLDEIGDVSPAFQAKLLRVLQEGEVQPLGSTRTVHVDARIVTATNKDLRELVRQGRFREDLFYRLHVVPITVPPLRERRADIPLLVHHVLGKLSARTGKTISDVSPRAMRVLMDHDYPGNVRELENALYRAFVLCRGSQIDLEHLPRELTEAAAQPQAVAPNRRRSEPEPGARGRLPAASIEAQRSEILLALQRHKWNRTAAARALGVARNTLWRKMKALGLEG
jgi:PAS domain S-box-containing protein